MSKQIELIDQYIREEEAECNEDCSALDNLRMWRVSALVYEQQIADLEADKAELDSFLWLFIDENKDPEALRRLRDMAAYLHRKHQKPAKEQAE